MLLIETDSIMYELNVCRIHNVYLVNNNILNVCKLKDISSYHIKVKILFNYKIFKLLLRTY